MKLYLRMHSHFRDQKYKASEWVTVYPSPTRKPLAENLKDYITDIGKIKIKPVTGPALDADLVK
jgi:hypothetical protein